MKYDWLIWLNATGPYNFHKYNMNTHRETDTQKKEADKIAVTDEPTHIEKDREKIYFYDEKIKDVCSSCLPDIRSTMVLSM